jgi:hypothetical protein
MKLFPMSAAFLASVLLAAPSLALAQTAAPDTMAPKKTTSHVKKTTTHHSTVKKAPAPKQ